MKKQKRPYLSIRKPGILGGKKAFAQFLSAQMVYPPAALQNKVEGIAQVKCEIDGEGRILKATSVHRLGFGLDEEAERLCMLMSFANTQERGLKIKHFQTIKIPFRLPEPEKIKLNYEIVAGSGEKKNYNYTIKLG